MNVKFYSDFLTFVVCVCTSLCIKIQDGGEKKKTFWFSDTTKKLGMETQSHKCTKCKKNYINYRPALDLSARKHRLIHS